MCDGFKLVVLRGMLMTGGESPAFLNRGATGHIFLVGGTLLGHDY